VSFLISSDVQAQTRQKTSVFAEKMSQGPPACSKVQFDRVNRLSAQICTRIHVDLCNLTYASLLKVHLDFAKKIAVGSKYVAQICPKTSCHKKVAK
jgi:hypothetical protein